MSLESLYQKASHAIVIAENYEAAGDPGVQAAYRDVSQLEEQIATLLPANDPEGAIARRGALRAALAAGDIERAKALKARYTAESQTPDELKSELEMLWTEALPVPSPRLAHASDLTDTFTFNALKTELTAA